MGLWRYSAIKLMGAALTGGDVDFRIDTVNLASIDRQLRPPSPELKEYLGNLAALPEVEMIETSDPRLR